MPNNQRQQDQPSDQGTGAEKNENKPDDEGKSVSQDNYGGQSNQPGLPNKSDEEWSPGSDRSKESEELWSPGSDKPNE